MSAIFGILRFDGGAISTGALERMSKTLAHRGPDGRKFVTAGPIGFGHCLMRVNHEDLFERQPLRDQEAELTVVADCRIDNREELAERFDIGTAELRDMPDSALVLRAYKTWGEDCASHLIGDFAFAVWDQRAGKLVLGRDHMGQRNIFYHKGDQFFAFSSEIKALWALPDVPRQLLDQEIALFFHKRVEQRPEGGTLYAGICAVPGGTVVKAGQDSSFETRRYWEPHPDPAHENREESYYVECYRSILAEAVACRLRRLGGSAALMMSAGFDTTAIAGLAGPVVAAQGRRLISLSWLGSKSTQTTLDDIRPWVEACRRVMPHLDIRYLSREGENPFTGIERTFLNYEGLGIGSRKISGYLFAEAATAGARLIMDGHGGDYTLNPRGYGALARHLRKGQLRRFFGELRPHMRATGQSPWQILKYEIILMQLPHSVIRWQRRVRRKGAPAWARAARRDIQGPYLRKLGKQNAAEAKPGIKSIPITAMRARVRYIASKIGRGAAAGGAVLANAHGLDLTRPFHDKRVVELGLAIPEDLYVKNGMNRYLARQALADVYPPEFQSRNRNNESARGGDIAILDAAIPELLAEADRMAKSAKLSAYFDFKRVHRMLLSGPNAGGADLAKKSAALRALLTARFIEWCSGSNAQ